MSATNTVETAIAQSFELLKPQEQLEILASKNSSASIRIHAGEVESFTRSESQGLGARLILPNGQVGYAYSESLSPESLDLMISSARANAGVIQADSSETLLSDAQIVSFPVSEAGSTSPSARDKIATLIQLEQDVLNYDTRITKVPVTGYSDVQAKQWIYNSHGLKRFFETGYVSAFTHVLASDGTVNKTGHAVDAHRHYTGLDYKKILSEATAEALGRLNPIVPTSGHYPVVFTPDAFASLFSAFLSIFSAKSLLEGKSPLALTQVGESLFADHVSLVDDPLDHKGLSARPFDDEGFGSQVTTLIENGVFKTHLHNHQTATKLKQANTGHATRSYKGLLSVGPSQLKLTGKTVAHNTLLTDKAVIVISDLAGLHSGTNPISGDFSLAAQGHLYHNGKLQGAVHQFTVAGNFLTLLKEIESLGDDELYLPNGYCLPSIRVKSLAISG
jgi:PmbA protein